MTKSTITREQLIKKAQEQIEFCRHTKITGEGRAHVNQCAALFEIALAAMDSEPDCNERQLFCSTDTARMKKVISVSAGSEDAPLYRHAQPAPVVPQDVLEALQKVARIRLDLNDFDGDRRGIADCLGDAEEALIEVVNRRAAMLAAAPHDAPALNSVQSVVTVPGKWIPVSERMPEAGVKVLCFPVEDEPIHAVFNGQLWLQDVSWSGSEEPIDNVIPVPVTHWMPLPEAPQEVSDA